MFDIGFSELFILVVIALLVLGPERLPGAVRKAGLIIGKIKGSWQSIQNEINSEFEAEELRKRIQKEADLAQQTLNSGFDADGYNQKILEQERKIRADIAKQASLSDINDSDNNDSVNTGPTKANPSSEHINNVSPADATEQEITSTTSSLTPNNDKS
ncbi:Sec-independent protein translocase protein TatB [Litoribacillus peritrichatus]|uniref:Sec-independent protein translocase protein TatB n=1 Tax=Litoribacillus peritrichatus TaxID=718191 RepID=A0ABP7MTD0_9GAMM